MVNVLLKLAHVTDSVHKWKVATDSVSRTTDHAMNFAHKSSVVHVMAKAPPLARRCAKAASVHPMVTGNSKVNARPNAARKAIAPVKHVVRAKAARNVRRWNANKQDRREADKTANLRHDRRETWAPS